MYRLLSTVHDSASLTSSLHTFLEVLWLCYCCRADKAPLPKLALSLAFFLLHMLSHLHYSHLI